MSSRLRPALSLLLVVALLAPPASSTWSICVVDLSTGEVCVATATCLADFDIKLAVPVVVVGQGAGAAQSAVDSGAVARQLMFAGFMAGDTANQIFTTITQNVSFLQFRQYGIVSTQGAPLTFTGTQAGAAAGGVTGTVGSLRYAIQGNVLTGTTVITAAESALLGTPGDLGQRVMAAMEAARALGGDGRCSCSPTQPTACGAPPPAFDKSAHTATIVLARIGDTDGACDGTFGCATGDYYLERTVVGNDADPDPVIELQGLYDSWRLELSGRPDHLLSTVGAGAAALPADGLTTTAFTVQLVDVEGVPLTSGGATLSVSGPDGAPLLSSPGPITDHGDGSYSFEVTAGTTTGTDSFVIVADDGTVTATLFPFPTLDLDPPAALHAGFDVVSSAAGADVPLTLDVGVAAAGQGYVVLGSVSGTAPGLPLPGGVLPLNPDPVFDIVLNNPGPPLFVDYAGILDGSGRASPRFVAPPGLLAPAVGFHFDWAAVILGPPKTPTNAVGFDVVP